MPLRLHGLAIGDSDGQNRFRFALKRLFDAVYLTFIAPRHAGESAQAQWPDKWFDKVFWQGHIKLGDTLEKIDCVAELYATTTLNIQRDMQERGFPHRADLTMLSVSLDVLLIYLRIFADTLAQVTPSLYGADGKNISRQSFRDQRKWFTEKRPDFDAAYASILDTHRKWFDLLAGKGGRGLRELVVHYRGTLSSMVYLEPVPDRAPVVTGLIADHGWETMDVERQLKDIFDGLCRFLDAYVEHFNELILTRTGWLPLNFAQPWQLEISRFDQPPPSSWLYPKAE
jgi:hypothetical protein